MSTVVASGLLAALGLGYLASASLLTAANIAILGASVAAWTLLWRLLALADRSRTIGVVRAYFTFHLLFVQIGLLAIYFASQRPEAVARFKLGFHVEPSLVAVTVPVVGMACFVAGVMTYSRRFRPVAPKPTDPPSSPDHAPQVRRILVLLVLGVAYALTAMAVRGTVPLLAVIRGADSQSVRLTEHYGSTPYLFHPSIVQQVTLVVTPFAGMVLWETSRRRLRRRWIAYVVGALGGVLLLNSLERTTMVTIGLWFALVVFFRRRRFPIKGLAVLGGGFLLMTLLLHGVSLEVLWNQVFRRFFIVNAMVNYFALEHFPGQSGFLGLTTYFDYVTKGVLGGGTTFAKELMGQVYPGQSIGTAPVGALVEGWVNVGWLMGPILFAQGVLFAHLDHRLRPRLQDPVDRVYFAGVVVFLASTSYSGLLSIAFSGGALPLTALYLFVRMRSAPAAHSARASSPAICVDAR
jgi:hypothetical protein